MTPEKVTQVLDKYLHDLRGYEPRRLELNVRSWDIYGDDRLRHLAWMCIEAKKFIAEGRVDKAFRWLGFIQGVLWVVQRRTIESLKKDNMPDAEEKEAQKGVRTSP